VHRRPREVRFREALVETGAWIALGLGFGALVWVWFGRSIAGQYYSGYLIEESLSVDNVFVWAVLLDWFVVPVRYQFRVLFWGVFGALGLRAVFIVAGVAVVDRFDPILYVFGAFLLYTAWRLLRGTEEAVDPATSRTLRALRRLVPSTPEYDGQRLFTKIDGRRLATPLFAVLVMIELTDVLFATDSIPAILAVSTHTFVLYSSNAFAVLGLRSLYFVVRGAKDRFETLDNGIAVILAFVGVKMLLSHVVHIGIGVSLAVIIGVLVVSIAWSVWRPAHRRRAP
jgi:tellurite resistance protein TerC